MANNSNKKLVPEAMSALDKFKYEVASEVGVNLKDGYNYQFIKIELGNFKKEIGNYFCYFFHT